MAATNVVCRKVDEIGLRLVDWRLTALSAQTLKYLYCVGPGRGRDKQGSFIKEVRKNTVGINIDPRPPPPCPLLSALGHPSVLRADVLCG